MTLGQPLAGLQVLLLVYPAHLLHEALQDGLLAVLLAVDLYGGDECYRGAQTVSLHSSLLVKLQALAGCGAVLDSVNIFNAETKYCFKYLSQNVEKGLLKFLLVIPLLQKQDPNNTLW